MRRHRRGRRERRQWWREVLLALTALVGLACAGGLLVLSLDALAHHGSKGTLRGDPGQTSKGTLTRAR